MNIPYVFKKCSKCGEWLVANTVNFNKHKGGRYSLQGWCKKCKNEYNKQYNKQYYENNKQYYEQYNHKYYTNHKLQRQQYDKQYNNNHKQEIAQYNKYYYEKNKQQRQQYHKQYHQTPEGQVALFNAYNRRKTNLENNGGEFTVEQWKECMEFFGWQCAYSGILVSTKNNRSIDHIVPLVKGGEHEVWNCVPMDKSLNKSKQDKDMMEWYTVQDFYSKERLDKIKAWQQYAYNKYGKQEEAQ